MYSCVLIRYPSAAIFNIIEFSLPYHMNRVISKEGEGTVFGNSPFELQERDAIQKVLQTDGSSASVGTHQSKTTRPKLEIK